MKTKSFITKITLAACLLTIATGSAFAQNSEDWNLPYGNMGLDYACDEINKVKSDIAEETGFSPFFDYYAVLLTNPSGGAEQGTNYTHEMLFGVQADLGKLIDWKGAFLTVSGAYDVGGNLSNKIGNFFTASESYVNNGALLYEIYISQSKKFDIGTVQVALGRMSMSDDFASLPVFGYLVSGGIDCTPEAMFANTPYSASPIATWGASVVFDTVQDLSFSAGIYQIPQNIDENWHGVDMKISSDDGYMAMFQVQWSPSLMKDKNGMGLDGIYQFGGYFYGGFNPNSFGTSDRENAYGFYLQGQQQVWKDSSDRFITVWAGMQVAPVESICIMPYMAYAGVQFQGFIPYRSKDGIYVSWMTGWFSGDFADTVSYDVSQETVFEFTYVIQLNKNVSIQPDFQYIIRPYGNGGIDNALVMGGQIIVSF